MIWLTAEHRDRIFAENDESNKRVRKIDEPIITPERLVEAGLSIRVVDISVLLFRAADEIGRLTDLLDEKRK